MHANFGLCGGRNFANTARFVSLPWLSRGQQQVMQLFALQWRILDLRRSPFFRTCRRWLSLSCLVWPLWGGIAPTAVWAQTGTWSTEPNYSLGIPRTEHATALLGNNFMQPALMVTGGIGNGSTGITSFAEFFSDSGLFYGAGGMDERRQGHTATSVPHHSHRALIAGGFSATVGTGVASAEFLELNLWGKCRAYTHLLCECLGIATQRPRCRTETCWWWGAT
jgi:hypothetical protein